MYILGLSGQNRDAAAALIRDGQVVAALEEEKLAGINPTGIDQCGNLPYQAISACLQIAGINITDVDYVAYYSHPWRSARRHLKFNAQRPMDSIYDGIAGINEFRESRLAQGQIKNLLSQRSKVISTDHQLAHAASSFYLSGYDRAAILVLGGVGDFVTIAAGIGEGTSIRFLDRIKFPTSLGWVYSLITECLGFQPYREEEKTQWLSLTGEPEFLNSFRDVIKLDRHGFPVVNTSYFAPLRRGPEQFSDRFYKSFGDYYRSNPGRFANRIRPREFADGYMNPNAGESSFGRNTFVRNTRLDEYRRNMACSLQRRLEEVVLAMAESLRVRLKVNDLCLAGGVALNTLLISKLASEGKYDRIFIQPAAGNTGAGLGAALDIWHRKFNGKRSDPLSTLSFGQEYSDEEIKPVLDNCKLSYRYLPTESKVVDEVADLLLQGQIVAWFQGRAEFGPRSLGNRSILATPMSEHSKENLNRFVKHCEEFRPFGVSVPEEDAGEFFEGCGELSRFLLSVSRIRDDKRQLIPAAWFGDGRARAHTVNRKNNPIFWRLLKRFGEKTGVPVLLNTSFNLFGQPIVCAPRDAVRNFSCSGIDALMINRFLVAKGA